MSGYPYGYPYQGQPPPSQQYPSYPPYGAFPPPPNGFGSTPPQSQQQSQQQQHYAPPTTGYHANAQAAYDYNANSIPGLGTPSGGPPPFSAPYNAAWNHGGFGTVAPQVPYSAYAPPAPVASTASTYQYPQAQAQVPQVPTAATPTVVTQSRVQSTNTAPQPEPKAQPAGQPKSQFGGDEVQEEGEIDDGYFDDLYDDASKAASVTNEILPVANKLSGDPGDDSLDQEPNFYDTDMEDVSAIQKPSAAIAQEKTEVGVKSQGQPDRDRSSSYSPQLSPTENGHTIRGNVAPARMQHSAPAGAVASLSKSTSTNASQLKNGSDVEAPVAAVASPVPGTTPVKPFASVFEATNEAKKAILRLLPHGIKYQTYIDEGFDAKLIKDLFTQLNLPTDSATSGPSEKPTTTQDKGGQSGSTQPAQQTQNNATDKKQEARKDKIARLMAEKKAKIAAASNNTGTAAGHKGVESSATATVVSTPPAKPPITRAEKDRLLQQKVEALRNKAREAKKLAQKPAPVETPKPDAAAKPTPPHAPTTTQSTVAPHSASGTPLSSTSQSAAPSPAVSVGSSLPRAPQMNQRKRPVAADFMDYPPLPVKRPSLANRQKSSLVISISDDDDDDDDVEMEVDSATEDSPASLPQALLNTKRGGPSIRDFPPLSNVKNIRQVHSPVNGLSVSGAKNANVDLETKERAILEMQRKIRELEAKKEAKARSGNVTPRSPSAGGNVPPEQALQTPVRGVVINSQTDDNTTPSSQLLQEAEAASIPMPELAIRNSQTEDEHPVRVASAQVAGKSAKALEKAERLRRMQEEMQKLQAEIDEEEDDVEVEKQVNSEVVEATAQPGETQPPAVTLAATVPESEHDVEVTHTEASSASFLKEELIASNRLSPENQAMSIDSSSESSDASTNSAEPSHATNLLDQLAINTPAASEVGKLPDANHSQRGEQSAVSDVDDLEDYEPPEAKIDVRVGADSPRFSPAPTKVDQPAPRQAGEGAETSREVFVGSSYPIGTSLTNRKAVNDIAPTRQTTFAPYESPLRYYHAYRFHANYNENVPGGLKSLTYSNRIDPNKEMCPDELEGNDCPRGDACQFQHFQSIIAPDSEIILELGSSDEFTGDQKRDFNNGLREVVASFQKSKVRDFRTIAQAIVDFRHRFLGDPSKVLRLEGVNI